MLTTVANGITLGRVPFLFLIVLLLYVDRPWAGILSFPLIVLLVLLDALDGVIARRRGEESVLGSVLDIAVDRVVEYVLWVVYADLDRIPIAFPLIVITRGLLVDAIRGYALGQGETAFGMMRSRWGRRLVSGRFMRALYGYAKAATFSLLALDPLWPLWTPRWAPLLHGIVWGLAAFTVFLCLLRGAPVFWDARRLFREAEPPPEP